MSDTITYPQLKARGSFSYLGFTFRWRVEKPEPGIYHELWVSYDHSPYRLMWTGLYWANVAAYIKSNLHKHEDWVQDIVVFRKWKEDGSIIALFPGLNYWTGATNRGNCMSYMHVGQHGEADYKGVMQRSRRAREEEYRPLLNELKGLGYILNVRNTAPDHRPADKPNL